MVMPKSRGIRRPRGAIDAWLAEQQGKHHCQCGCGAVLVIKRDRFYKGIPRYQHGHNPQPTNPVPEPMACACGCGALAKPGNRYVNGHNGRGQPRPPHVVEAIRRAQTGESNHRFGVRPKHYKGWHLRSDGYIMRHCPEHPFAVGGGNVMEHRLVLEDHLRRTDPTNEHLVEVDGVLYLSCDAIAHHIDGVKTNNVPENLEAMTQSEHMSHHQAERKASR